MQTAQLPAIELGFREGSSDKLYQAAIEGANDRFVVNFAYGRRGATLNTGTKTQQPVPYDEALSIYEKLVNSKTAKGYKPAGSSTGMVTNRESRDTGLRAQLLNPITEDEARSYLANPAWCAQEKFDGMRMLMRKTGETVTAANRHGLSVGFPAILEAELADMRQDFVLDGECVGSRLHAFDLLELDGRDLRGNAYLERLTDLNKLFTLSGRVIPAETALGAEKAGFTKKMQASNKEGVVFKKLAAAWTVGRPASGGDALKCKFWASCSCVALKVNGRRSVELGLGGASVGNVTIPPNKLIPTPGQVVEVRYLYVQGVGGSLYQPTYLGVRTDVKVAECTVERQKLKYRAEED